MRQKQRINTPPELCLFVHAGLMLFILVRITTRQIMLGLLQCLGQCIFVFQ